MATILGHAVAGRPGSQASAAGNADAVRRLRVRIAPARDVARQGAVGQAGRRPSPSAAPTSAASGPPRRPSLVLEAEVGGVAGGVFVVGNMLAREVTAPVVLSPFISADGREAKPATRIEPATVMLEPGEQTLVQVWAAIDEGCEPGVAYRAEARVPGMSEDGVPVILRRRPAVSAEGAAESARHDATLVSVGVGPADEASIASAASAATAPPAADEETTTEGVVGRSAKRGRAARGRAGPGPGS